MRSKHFVLMLIGAALLQRAALADSLTYTHLLVYNDVYGQQTGWGGQDYHFWGEVTYGMDWYPGSQFSQFDSSLGHLDSIDWAVTLHGELSSHFFYWPSPASVAGVVGESWTVQFIRIGSSTLPGKYLSINTVASAGDTLSVPVSGTADGNLLLQGTVASHMTDPGLLNDFSQETSLYLDTVSHYNFSAASADGGPAPPDLQVQLSYTYNFTPVPEPSLVGLLALGGVAFWAFGRRKSAAGNAR